MGATRRAKAKLHRHGALGHVRRAHRRESLRFARQVHEANSPSMKALYAYWNALSTTATPDTAPGANSRASDDTSGDQ